jgi:hypothetical protein
VIRNFKRLRRLCGGGFGRPILLKELFGKSEEGQDRWGSLVTEAVWNEFSTQYFFTTILKARRYPLSFLHRELDIGQIVQFRHKGVMFMKGGMGGS